MNELALFAGAGGGLLASKLLGWTTVGAVEIEQYPREVLLQRQRDGILEDFPIWDDVRTFDGKPWRGLVDVVSGGFPCQPHSTAARGRNKEDTLWTEMQRIIFEVSPSFVFAENVTKKAINMARSSLESLGYSTVATGLSAKDLGADHIRKRYWILGYPNKDCQPMESLHAEVERVSLSNHCVWKTDPRGCRVADGVADRVDRLKAIGNGQVPIVAAAAWSILTSGIRKDTE